MSKPRMFEKPSGVRDYLPEAVRKLREIERKVLHTMECWGYVQIITPTMEFYDTVGMASATSDQKLFKLLNQRGTPMVLRSDMTGPIARVVSSLLGKRPFPIRLSYHANVFRAMEEEAGREAEFFQTGAEPGGRQFAGGRCGGDRAGDRLPEGLGNRAVQGGARPSRIRAELVRGCAARG